MKLFELFATLSLDTKNFNADIEKASRRGGDLSKELTGIVARGTAAGTAMYNFGRQAVSALFQTGKDLVKTAADVRAETAAYESTFKGIKGSANEAFKAVADDTNILAGRLRNVGTKAFSQFKGAGMDASTALETMETYLKLAADGAAYYDISMEDADARLRSFLRGNTEAGDQIGLFTSELQRNNKALELYDKKWLDLNEAQRQMVMLDIVEDIYGQANVIGQAAKEGDSYANVMANLGYNIKQVAAVLGQPIMEHLTPFLGKVSDFVRDNPEIFESLAGVLDRISKIVFTPLQDALEWIDTHSSQIAAAFDEIAEAVDLMYNALARLTSGDFHKELTEDIGKLYQNVVENPEKTWEGLNTPLIDTLGKIYGDGDKEGSTPAQGSIAFPGGGNASMGEATLWDGANGLKNTLPGFATGLRFVPHDDFRARLHRGERVLTAREAKNYEDHAGGNYSEFLEFILEELAAVRSLLSGIGGARMSLYMDKKRVGSMTVDEVERRRSAAVVALGGI